MHKPEDKGYKVTTNCELDADTREPHGVGYFQSCRPVTTEYNPLRFLEPTPEIPSNFWEFRENLGCAGTSMTVTLG